MDRKGAGPASPHCGSARLACAREFPRFRSAALDGTLAWCQNIPEQRLGMTQVSRGAFRSDDADIAYLDVGAGAPIVLVHGFASTKETNWLAPGWVDTLTRAGRRVIALDNRGHGESTKLYDPAAYHSSIMAEDIRGLIEHLGFERADVMGYSMGARNTAFLALAHPDRTRSAVLGGLGMRLVEGVGLPDTIADALEAPAGTT